MFSINQDKPDGLVGRLPKELRGAFLRQLVFIGDRLGLCKIFRWLEDEAQRKAMIRELNLSDHYLRDLGIERRYSDLRTDDLEKRLRVGG